MKITKNKLLNEYLADEIENLKQLKADFNRSEFSKTFKDILKNDIKYANARIKTLEEIIKQVGND